MKAVSGKNEREKRDKETIKAMNRKQKKRGTVSFRSQHSSPSPVSLLCLTPHKGGKMAKISVRPARLMILGARWKRRKKVRQREEIEVKCLSRQPDVFSLESNALRMRQDWDLMSSFDPGVSVLVLSAFSWDLE